VKIHFTLIAGAFGLLLLFITSCSDTWRVSYKGDDIKTFNEKKIGIELRFETSYGTQSAYYIFPSETGGNIPARLVIAYPGITGLALGWLDLISDTPYSDVGFLLIEYPGRGNSQGIFRPKYLGESSSGALKALVDHLGISRQEITKNIVFLGHSFGCGEALQFAAEILPKRIVLIAPFSTLRRAAFRQIGPLAWIMPNMDNCERIKELCRLSSPPKIIIFHGSADETLPVSMGRDLAACSPRCVEYHEIEKAGHKDILHNARQMIMNALLDSQEVIPPQLDGGLNVPRTFFQEHRCDRFSWPQNRGQILHVSGGSGLSIRRRWPVNTSLFHISDNGWDRRFPAVIQG